MGGGDLAPNHPELVGGNQRPPAGCLVTARPREPHTFLHTQVSTARLGYSYRDVRSYLLASFQPWLPPPAPTHSIRPRPHSLALPKLVQTGVNGVAPLNLMTLVPPTLIFLFCVFVRLFSFFQEAPVRLSPSRVQRARPSQRPSCCQPPADPTAQQQPALPPGLSQHRRAAAAAPPAEAGRAPVARHGLQRAATSRPGKEAVGGLSAGQPGPLRQPRQVRLQRGRTG